jgi:hypothetical protein
MSSRREILLFRSTLFFSPSSRRESGTKASSNNQIITSVLDCSIENPVDAASEFIVRERKFQNKTGIKFALK